MRHQWEIIILTCPFLPVCLVCSANINLARMSVCLCVCGYVCKPNDRTKLDKSDIQATAKTCPTTDTSYRPRLVKCALLRNSRQLGIVCERGRTITHTPSWLFGQASRTRLRQALYVPALEKAWNTQTHTHAEQNWAENSSKTKRQLAKTKKTKQINVKRGLH